MKKTLLLSFSLFIFGINIQAAPTPAVVTIPDSAFKAALIVAGVDKDHDGEIQVTEAQATTDLDVSSSSITDLTGIEAFTALVTLACYDNALTTLNVSSNTALTMLDCGSNKLKALNVSANVLLQSLDCSADSISILDLSTNTVLENLTCSNNNLISLNLNANTKLSVLKCSHNLITTVNIAPADTAMTSIECNNNLLASIDVTNCKNLTDLNVEFNELTALDVSKNKLLTSLNADNNTQLTLICINAAQLTLATVDKANWVKTAGTSDWSTTNCADSVGAGVGIEEYVISTPKTVIHILNLYGQEVLENEIVTGVIYIYQYSDGTVQKIVRL